MSRSRDRLPVTVVSSFGGVRGGAEQWLASALELTDQLRVRAVLLQDGPLADELAAHGADVAVIPTGSSPAAIMRASTRVLADFRRHRPAVVAGNNVKAQLALIGPARALRIPSVWIKHDHSYDSLLALRLGAASTEVVSTALEVGLPTRRSDLVVIEPPRPPEPLPRSEALAELAQLGYRPGEGTTLVMIGRLVPYKGVDIGITALTYPAADGWRLAVIGDDGSDGDAELHRLRRLAADLGVMDRVDFLGAIPGAGRLVAAFDALAVLTRPGQRGAPDREGYGITATEAMLAAVPVVVAGKGPIARRLDTPAGPAGLVVRPADPLATARALQCLTVEAERATLGAAGRAVAVDLPDAQQVSDALVEVLCRAAASGGRHGG